LRDNNFENINSHPLLNNLLLVQRVKINKSITRLLASRQFSHLIKGEIKTEVNIGVLEDNMVKLGRIDLLVIHKDYLVIVDYKSDLKPASSIELVPEGYKEQLRFYNKAISALYPNHKIECKILWLQNGKLMNI
ncbi:MAG: PD-(D/E)XK nuclease family protein, partial [Janthinobacterium lividum]